MKKIFYIGQVFVLLAGLFCSPASFAEATLRVVPSSTEIGIDENVSLEFKAKVDEYSGEIDAPDFSAPDFDKVNMYAGMSGVQSTIINGHISVTKTKDITVVLHPKRTGKFIIRDISQNIAGKKVTAPNIEITVVAAGSGRSSKYFGHEEESPLPGSGVKPSTRTGNTFFIRTEPSKLRAYKGEQIILNYTLYTTVPIMGIQVERYPTVQGFLKEDIDIPLLGNRLTYTRSVVGGKEYNRALLAAYAVFPLKEGKLNIDPLTGKFTYRMRNPRGSIHGDEDDDPFAVLNQFMRTMSSSTDTRSSDRVTIDVLPIPAAGQPRSFMGLVGDFNIVVMVDKYQVKAGEPVNVKIKIEGKGHAGSLEHLNVDWPKDFEQYEDKSSTQYNKNGKSERVFDFMLIPRAQGEFEIPPVELAMFNPDQEKYVIRKSEPVKITVTEGNGQGSMPQGQASASSGTGVAVNNINTESIKKGVIDDLKSELKSDPVSKLTKWLSILLTVFSVFGVGLFIIRQIKLHPLKMRSKVMTKEMYLNRVKETLKLDIDPEEVLQKSESIISEILKQKFEISIGSQTRSEIKELLSEKKIPPETVSQCESLLERCENLRFAPGAAKPELARLVAQDLQQFIERVFLRN